VLTRRHRVRLAFAVAAVLGIFAVFVLDGAAAGVAALAAMLTFSLACIAALRGESAEDRRRSDKTGLVGWIGNYF
jgi:hypothetical protein